MKKPVISLLLLLFTFVLSAQISIEMTNEISLKKKNSETIVKNAKTTPVWEVTFEEETPVWTFGTDVGTKLWSVSDTTPSYGWTNVGVETSPLWIYMGYKYVNEYSESENNFAWVDGISDMLEIFPMEVFSTYIQFDEIDLTEVDNPKLIFYQNYKALGDAHTYVDFSVDGGVTWTSMEVNESVGEQSYGEDLFEALITPYAANEINVSIRFRWESTSASNEGYGYGWEIDDIQIVECDPYDLALVDARMNFFEYYDYHDYFTQDYFHLSSHYGQIPQEQYNSENANSCFNIMVRNNGISVVTPMVNIQVLDPDMIEIYSVSTYADAVALETFTIDTIDVLEFPFHPGDNPMIGRYTVVYSVSIPEQDDATPLNNTDTTYFEVTSDVYARNLNEPDGEIGPCMYYNGGIDGEKFGTTFSFLYEDVISSVDVFIGENTSPGTAIIVHFMEFDSELNDWLDVVTSSLITLEETNIGGWINVDFTDPAYVNIPDGYDMTSVLVAIEMYYEGEENDIFIGYDSSLSTSIWGMWWYLMDSEYQWMSTNEGNLGGLGIKLNMENVGPLCPEDFSVCLTDEPFELTGLLEHGAIYTGDYVIDNIFYPTEAGVGEHMVACSYSNYDCTFTITVNPLPEQEILVVLPESGVLDPEVMGSVSIQESDSNTTYWTTRDDVVFFDEIQENGGILSLGSEYTDGTYVVWSRGANSCEVSQGVITFLDNDSETKIVANVSFGFNELLTENESFVSLYKSQLNEVDEVEIVLDSTLFVNSSGVVVFDGIDAGEYYLGSELVNPEEYNSFSHVYYEEQMIFEDATPIIIEEGTIFLANIYHPVNPDMEGSNNGSGTVGNQEEGKAVDPVEGKVVILKSVDTEEVLSVSVTDVNGYYEFEGIPDNTNIQLFVSNFETPNWISYNTFVGNGETFEVNFIVHQDSVYPEGYQQIETIISSNSVLELYPNPVSEVLHFVDTPDLYNLKIFDSQGRLITEIKSTNVTELDVSEFLSGLYFVVLTSDDGFVSVNRFVKQQ